MQRAIELGHREPRHLLRLARALNEQQRVDELWEVLDLIPDDPADPALGGREDPPRRGGDDLPRPAAGLPGLEEAARRWAALGETGQARLGARQPGRRAVLPRPEPTSPRQSLRESLAVFRDAGDRDGQMAAYRFLALVCPDDPHAREWVTESLQRAEEVGDRTAQVNSYNTLAWHHFMRSRLGGVGRHRRAAPLPRPARRDRATSWACTRWRPTGSAWPPTWLASRGASTTPAGSPPRPVARGHRAPVDRARADGRVLVRARAR